MAVRTSNHKIKLSIKLGSCLHDILYFAYIGLLMAESIVLYCIVLYCIKELTSFVMGLFRRFCEVRKSDYWFRYVSPSVSLHGTNPFPLHVFFHETL